MNPHLLTLALTTPLEQLLELPNAVRIAACAREDLQRFSAEQLAQMLASMDVAITDSQVFKSLSAAARHITGTRWNGPKFFGLRDGKGDGQ